MSRLKKIINKIKMRIFYSRCYSANKAVRIDELKRVFEFIRSVQDEYRDMDIVHCKDCKHWGTGIAGETENVKCCEYGKYMVGANGYCVYGEKECD